MDINGKVYKNQQSLNIAIRSVCDILRRSNCASALQYIPELTWILFLRILDEKEIIEAKMNSCGLTYSLKSPYRWSEWAAPFHNKKLLLCDSMKDKTNLGWKRQELLNQESNALIDFVNNELFPYLKSLRDLDDATSRQKIIGEIFSNLDKTRIDSQDNLLNILDKIHNIRLESVDTTHIFSLSQAYEGLLLKMGEKKNDGGQFFTPREITRVMITIIKPTIGETIYDPCCGTGGFLAQAYEFFVKSYKDLTEEETKFIKHNTFFGREKDNLVYPITLANLIIHGIDEPHIWHGNTLSRKAVYDGLFQGSPQEFDVILTNPPFGGKEGKDVQSQFRYQTSATQILFLQHIIEHLKPGGRCGIIVDEGVLFRTNEAFLYTKKWLLQECNLWCIISLPIGVFANAGASIKTNILFFTKGSPTNEIWYYDMSDIKISKKTPLTFELFEDFFNLFPTKKITNRSWIVDVNKLEAMKFDLKAVNPNITFVDNFGSINEIVTQIEFEMETISTLLSEANGWITHNK